MNRISNFAKPLGIAMAAIGIAMVAVSGYYLYAYMRSGSDAEHFNVDAAPPEDMLVLLGQGLPEPVSDEPISLSASAAQERSEVESEMSTERDEDSSVTVSIASILPDVVLVSDAESADVSVAEPKIVPAEMVVEEQPVVSRIDSDAAYPDDAVPPPSVPTDVMIDTFAAIYPGGNMNPRYWSEPHWAGNLPFGGPTIPEGFVPVDASDMAYASKSGERALRMRIPSIDLDATVSELEIRDLGDSREWSTPDKVVGHIPTTAHPGELANGWYFGHLDDFLSNEGDIFRRLPEISAMIKDDPVDIFLTTSDAEYMYRVTATRQMHRNELYLAKSDNSQVSLVTCWPFKVYDQRIVVSAVLIAVKPLAEV